MPTVGKLKVEYRPVGKLKPYARNPRIHSPAQITKLVHLIKTYGWTNPILVDGKNGIIAGHSDGDVWEVARDNGHGKETTTHHPTQKPVELARRALVNSTQAGEVVVDMFAGSGSTLIGAEQTERVCYCLELDPRYADVIVRRWQELTGKQATHATEKKTFDAIAKRRLGRTRGG